MRGVAPHRPPTLESLWSVIILLASSPFLRDAAGTLDLNCADIEVWEGVGDLEESGALCGVSECTMDSVEEMVELVGRSVSRGIDIDFVRDRDFFKAETFASLVLRGFFARNFVG
jgi:hypothetical protein